MKRHKNENEFLAMVGTGEQEVLSLISLFQGAEDTKSTIRLKGKKKQFRGASSNSKEKAASAVLYCPHATNTSTKGHLQWQAKGQRWEMLETWRFYHHSKIPPEQTFQTIRSTSDSWKATSIELFLNTLKRNRGWGNEPPSLTGFISQQGWTANAVSVSWKNGKTQVDMLTTRQIAYYQKCVLALLIQRLIYSKLPNY